MRHCAVITCDRPPVGKLEWPDSIGRRCFAWFCETHLLEAHVEMKAGKTPTLDDLFPDLTEKK